ncbi:hypothetical protein BECAL_03002 [Bellilinea caldifistulae]|uniref:Uncharacterized protein n=1 Tax=Bellilinea caldifistulae TaxID=360411 RepID=A0A0P6X133_9CHLR|nr:hypothetical protein [Bellilinea caldifistulae]KPL74592.1 hypothetical protein AC812_12420 [Bellilinea caldifistulae]GAP11808.1 hypothetical protein BECAL_03002 [Bellilinea caldifistulae]
MSYAFRKHDYNLDDFDRCPEHGCVMMQVQDLPPVCLIEWLVKNAAERRVRDVIPREPVNPVEAGLPGVVLDNGFLLPVRKAVDVASRRPDGEVNESIVGWRVTDILYMRGENQELVGVELLPDGTVVDEDPGFLLYLDMQILLYLLFDEEIRKCEP